MDLIVPIILLCGLAFYVACNLGANDVANSMGTSVGSKALTLKQAIIVAGILEFTGAVLFGERVSKTLATGVVNPEVFISMPQEFVIGMVSVLISAGLWLQIATRYGLPVSSSHAVVGAIAGFSCIAAGLNAVDWLTIGLISLTWLLTPLMSGIIAALFYTLIKHWILDQPDPHKQIREWIPWLSCALIGIFGVIVFPILSPPLQNTLNQWGWTLPAHDIPLAIGGIAAVSLTWISWRQLEQQQNLSISNTTPEKFPGIEKQLAQFQVISACFVAFAHGSNDVGNTIAPLAAILAVIKTGSVPLADIEIPTWLLLLGGSGIVTGLAIWGKNVIKTVGENIISLVPSEGFCAELATATTVLLASRLGLPVSTSHALVGGVVGIGLVQGGKSVRLDTVRSIVLAWVITVPTAALLSAILFKMMESIL
ncbi:Putative phosphate permease HI_1604 [Planktothrix tepida]|uniref:Phosphate transporter n=2 Tax=Planktothrix TaxID=54304 RepID=A0A1J1LN32_9CYAN|nr:MULTISPECIES: inorganic phosphate transporter [Planktothrix]CAD5937256.1 Putative phosphate permease HI_1604 [Planktothrix tepida]CAD5974406.1 Putative phosphate permease HI_1604 [Planktothrix pseudagardhii]CUR33348.1 Phosphate transporter [Planktothrix tepida PCC 9214]